MEQKNAYIHESVKQMEIAANAGSDETAQDVLDSELEERYRKYREKLQDLTIMSDTFMRNVLKEPKCTEYVLQVIMDEKNLRVISQTIQKDYKNLQGRSALLDCVARDADHHLYNIEIQQEREGASPKRARYHSGLMDMNTLKAGQDFDELPESYVIFITRDDVFGDCLPLYHIGRTIHETGEDFGDESHVIYVNTKHQEDSELGRMIHDFHCRQADEMYSEILANRVRELKETEEGVKMMCEFADEIYREGEARGEARGEKNGIEKKQRQVSMSLARKGMQVSEIAQVVEAEEKLVCSWLAEAETAGR